MFSECSASHARRWKHVKIPGAEVIGGCELPCEFSELNLGPLKEEKVLFWLSFLKFIVFNLFYIPTTVSPSYPFPRTLPQPTPIHSSERVGFHIGSQQSLGTFSWSPHPLLYQDWAINLTIWSHKEWASKSQFLTDETSLYPVFLFLIWTYEAFYIILPLYLHIQSQICHRSQTTQIEWNIITI